MTSASPSETLRAYLCDAAKVGVCSDLNLPWAAVWEQTAKLNCNSAHSCRYVPGLSELHIQRLLQSEITETLVFASGLSFFAGVLCVTVCVYQYKLFCLLSFANYVCVYPIDKVINDYIIVYSSA